MEGVFGVEVSKAREKEESLCGVSRSKLTGVGALHRSCRGGLEIMGRASACRPLEDHWWVRILGKATEDLIRGRTCAKLCFRTNNPTMHDVESQCLIYGLDWAVLFLSHFQLGMHFYQAQAGPWHCIRK